MILVTQPSISSNKHKFYQIFFDNFDFHACMHHLVTTTINPPPDNHLLVTPWTSCHTLGHLAHSHAATFLCLAIHYEGFLSGNLQAPSHPFLSPQGAVSAII